MIKKKCAVFSCQGLGDGLISLVLSNNFLLNNFEVTTFHPFLHQLQDWFPGHSLLPLPSKENLVSSLSGMEKIFIFLEKSSSMQYIMEHCIKHFPEQTCILNPIATFNKDYPFWENGCFDGRLSLVDNLENFCKNRMRLPIVSKHNGIRIPFPLLNKKYAQRVVIHTTSSREGKNWPMEKYLVLSERLLCLGFEPFFVFSENERKACKIPVNVLNFTSMTELASFVAESGIMIGNDSGIGHLASCLGLPTLTICRSLKTLQFWRPAWSEGLIVAPPSFIPNFKGMRIRDKQWKKWVSVNRVERFFHQLIRVET